MTKFSFKKWGGYSLLFIEIIFFILFPERIQASTLVLAGINQNPNNELSKLLPFVNYLAHHLQSDGFDKGSVRIEKTIPPIATLMKKGKIDLFLGGPFTSVALHQLAKTNFLLQGITEGSDKHYSVIFVRNDSSVKHLKDLKGKVIAFENPLSTFGYSLPKGLMLERGLKFKLLKTDKENVAPDEVAYQFSNDDENTILWVKKGKVIAGAVDYEIYKLQAKETLDQLRIIEKTISLPPYIISFRENLSPEVVSHLKEVLKKMHQTDEGKAVLKNLNEIWKFQDFSQRTLSPFMKLYDSFSGEFKVK